MTVYTCCGSAILGLCYWSINVKYQVTAFFYMFMTIQLGGVYCDDQSTVHLEHLLAVSQALLISCDITENHG